jgi:hypothetical protein
MVTRWLTRAMRSYAGDDADILLPPFLLDGKESTAFAFKNGLVYEFLILASSGERYTATRRYACLFDCDCFHSCYLC